MQFITSLFGGSGNTILTMLLALGVVIVLILLAVWLLRVVFNVSGTAVRGRNRRLAVIDTLALDQKRQLVIIRRDDVEHLILTGGPQDVVIETGIPVDETAQTQNGRRPVPQVPVARKADPQPTAPVAPTPIPAPVPAPQPVAAPAPAPEPAPIPTAAPGTVLEQLQKAGYSGDRKTRVSLRHTGLLRGNNRKDASSGQNPDNSGSSAGDSVKQDASKDSESAALEHDPSNEANRG